MKTQLVDIPGGCKVLTVASMYIAPLDKLVHQITFISGEPAFKVLRIGAAYWSVKRHIHHALKTSYKNQVTFVGKHFVGATASQTWRLRSQPSKKTTTAPTQVCASASQGWCSAKLRVRKSKSLGLGKLHDTACSELLIVKVIRARGEAKQQNQQQKKE